MPHMKPCAATRFSYSDSSCPTVNALIAGSRRLVDGRLPAGGHGAGGEGRQVGGCVGAGGKGMHSDGARRLPLATRWERVAARHEGPNAAVCSSSARGSAQQRQRAALTGEGLVRDQVLGDALGAQCGAVLSNCQRVRLAKTGGHWRRGAQRVTARGRARGAGSAARACRGRAGRTLRAHRGRGVQLGRQSQTI
jgi:hypothetical protein